jgi:hypothetical protein
MPRAYGVLLECLDIPVFVARYSCLMPYDWLRSVEQPSQAVRQLRVMTAFLHPRQHGTIRSVTVSYVRLGQAREKSAKPRCVRPFSCARSCLQRRAERPLGEQALLFARGEDQPLFDGSPLLLDAEGQMLRSIGNPCERYAVRYSVCDSLLERLAARLGQRGEKPMTRIAALAEQANVTALDFDDTKRVIVENEMDVCKQAACGYLPANFGRSAFRPAEQPQKRQYELRLCVCLVKCRIQFVCKAAKASQFVDDQRLHETLATVLKRDLSCNRLIGGFLCRN